MSNTRQLIMTFNKIQRLPKLFNRFNMHRHISTAFIYNELLTTASCKTYSIPVQSALHFSTSIVVNSNSETMSEGKTSTFNLNYTDILEAQKDDSILIIDVREKEEIDETGKLPGSIHIPMGEVSNTLMNLSEQDFKERFDKKKPSKDTKIILSCRSGKRSGIVQEELQKFGYENAYNYVGGWLDWESNQKV
ncbi:rhodanese domain-containing protein CG4456 isoform X1 [Megachile rotundata]|uniref:rhodanese domain-containing protein CG4456 isoform X1 n=2 Tax=Megachile rotundata TaxID=143995 RepID=UPI000614AB56|nr:PREDICTED: heat shock protein 67B2-like isoform X1 [Megachile rotundata]XP_012138736.1 PREDICTED: heat shock protein 67B2-like isoform X1 [Megachile rotundata]XP_012138737.1 PREDICTED: heat shock protein 67B2-like isoform X1 [Megachile rotundata]XP_012138738.1 PREDICTED: heat shock protein 67B2-like isoform X1 [Megachile rotundata]